MPAPRRQVRSSGSATVIELSIPVRRRHLVSSDSDDDSDDDDLTCYICANSFCDSESCNRSLTHLGCCTQAICCGCLLKSCKRCMCKDECDAVISLCPFCREVSPVDALDVYLGSKSTCGECKAADEPAVAPTPVVALSPLSPALSPALGPFSEVHESVTQNSPTQNSQEHEMATQ